jgi:prolipoprotein diacylglyceryltransferase
VSFHHPVPLYAVIMNLVLFWGLNTLYRRIHDQKHRWPAKGMIPPLYLIGYGGFRFLLEWLRTETIVGKGMTLAQWSMLVFMGLGLIVGIFMHLTRPQPPNHAGLLRTAITEPDR